MKRKVFIQLPGNNPSGGVKVGNQLVNLFREHNYESYVVLPSEVYQADWLINPAPTIGIAKMREIVQRNDIVIDNWPDKRTLAPLLRLKAKTKIFYLQGCTFSKDNNLIGDKFLRKNLGYTHFWVVSKDSLDYLKRKYSCIPKWYLINPYFDFKAINQVISGIKRENKILCLTRKGRNYIKLANLIFGSKIKFEQIDRIFSEKEFYQLAASSKFFLSTAVGIDNHYFKKILNFKKILKIFLNIFSKEKKYSITSYIIPIGHKEGFHLPPAEAAMCSSIVIGFAMGGGLEWMSPSTCFLAKDRSYFSLIKKTQEALSCSDERLDNIRKNALKAVSKFNKGHTWQQIEAFLNELT